MRGVQMIPASVLRDLRSGAPVTREPALTRAVDIIHERLSFLEYVAPDPSGNVFEHVAAKSPKPGKD